MNWVHTIGRDSRWSGTLRSMVSYMISYNHDIMHWHDSDIIVLKHYDIIALLYHSTMISFFLYDITYDIKIVWYHRFMISYLISWEISIDINTRMMISFIISYFWIYDIKIIWYHSSMISYPILSIFILISCMISCMISMISYVIIYDISIDNNLILCMYDINILLVWYQNTHVWYQRWYQLWYHTWWQGVYTHCRKRAW